MSWYLDKPIYWLCHPSVSYSVKLFKIKAPLHCKYYNGEHMYIPLIKFNLGSVKNNLSKIALNNNLNIEKINEF